MVYAQVTWIFVCAIFLSVFVAYGIGANDVANAFGSSVGAKALTMRQAILVAGICEFTGAVLMGSGVTSTIRSGIANLNYYTQEPDILAYGMLCVMMATGLWLLIATYWELPVSTTHSVVGSVVGMSMVAAGVDSVIWSKEKDSFPFLSGMSAIVLSWVFSPLLAGFFAIVLFFFTRLIVLRSPRAYERSIYMLPIFVFATFYLCTWFIITKGGQQFNWQNTPDSKKAWISAISASGACLISIVVGIPLLKRKVAADLEAEERAAEAAAAAASEEAKPGKEEAGPLEDGSVEDNKTEATPGMLRTFRKSRVWKAATAGINYDVHEVINTDATIHEIHSNAEVFDHKAETSFKYLQVFTACCNAFAHGSNDVANAIGPFAAIYSIWVNSAVSKNSSVPTWILAIGGFGIVFGLATYGYKIMRVLGVKMTKLTNSRGFAVELAAAAVVILGSRFDLPLSTTHSMVGAVTGIGLLEGRGAFNWRLLVKFFIGWVGTLIIAGATAAAFTAQGIYAPSRFASEQRASMAAYLNCTTTYTMQYLNATGNSLAAEAISETLTKSPWTDLWDPTNSQQTALGFLNANATNAGSCFAAW